MASAAAVEKNKNWNIVLGDFRLFRFISRDTCHSKSSGSRVPYTATHTNSVFEAELPIEFFATSQMEVFGKMESTRGGSYLLATMEDVA